MNCIEPESLFATVAAALAALYRSDYLGGAATHWAHGPHDTVDIHYPERRLRLDMSDMVALLAGNEDDVLASEPIHGR
jgi:hypothetical protein